MENYRATKSAPAQISQQTVSGRNVHDRSWIKNDYKKLRKSLHERKETTKQNEVERTQYQPYTWQSLYAYSNTSVGDIAMKTNHNPVKVTPFGMRPVDAISTEYGRSSTLRPVNPEKSLEMDSALSPRDQPGLTGEEGHEREDETKDHTDAKEQSKTTAHGGSKTKENNQQSSNDGKEKKTEKQEGGEKEPKYMQIPYQLPRERRVVFKPLKILDEKKKEELNYDDLKKIRKEVRDQKQERGVKRRDENYIMTQRDWKDMDFDNLYELRLEADKKRLQFPIVRYFGAYKKGSRDAATELAEPLNPSTADEPENQTSDEVKNTP
ncbi:uncharacterized protein LOC142351201 isoform X2 [Convolutriloba macropyga]|uniref:uncharacterized protein LOC142351201 isoform X2 n=1 Tax=Convolutriloba macropyga TaxID=536237 RepID=UPI003F52136D